MIAIVPSLAMVTQMWLMTPGPFGLLGLLSLARDGVVNRFCVPDYTNEFAADAWQERFQ